MTAIRRVAATLLLGLAVGAAQAHPGHGAASLQAGLLHPLTGADHLLAMLAVGVWSSAALRAGRVVVGPLVFVAALAAGTGLALQGVSLGAVEAGVAASIVLLAALLLAGRRARVPVGLAAIATAGLLHGHAHGSELVAGQSAAGWAAGFMLASAALHLVGVGLGLRLRECSTHAWNALAASLAASGLWMLATRL